MKARLLKRLRAEAKKKYIIKGNERSGYYVCPNNGFNEWFLVLEKAIERLHEYRRNYVLFLVSEYRHASVRDSKPLNY